MSYRSNDFNDYLISVRDPNNNTLQSNRNFPINNNNFNYPQNFNNSVPNVLMNTNNSNFNNTTNNFTNNNISHLNNNSTLLTNPQNLNFNQNNITHNTSIHSNYSTSNDMNSTELNSKYNQYKRNLNISKNIVMSSPKSNNFDNNNKNSIANINQINSNLLNGPEFLDQNFLDKHLLNTVIPENEKSNEVYNKHKFNSLKKMYDERIKSLYDQIRLIYNRFESDEILSTMKNDYSPNNQEFLRERFREIINENFISEKENIISAFQEEISELNSQINFLNKNLNERITKSNFDSQEYILKMKDYETIIDDYNQKNQFLQNEISNQKVQIQSMQTNFENEIKKVNDQYNIRFANLSSDFQKIKSDNISFQEHLAISEAKFNEINIDYEENKLEMDRLQKVISVLEIDLNVNEGKLNEKQSKIDSLQQEITNIQTQYFEINLKYKKYMEENKNLEALIEHFEKERKEIFDKYNSFNEDLQKNHNEKLENTEKQYKEKYANLKQKIIELKGIISKLEEELNLEKNNALEAKINYSKIITKMQEDMKLIKTEWEKKCKEQTVEYEKFLSELEAKHAIELNTMKQELIEELENRNKEISKYKQSADLLKNFEKEFIRIPKHEEILNETLAEMKKKFNQDILLKEQELENELRKRLVKLDEDKKGEYEFLTDNTRKTLKNLDKQNEDLKAEILELQNKFNLEKLNNEHLDLNNHNLQKSLREYRMEIEEKDLLIRNLK